MIPSFKLLFGYGYLTFELPILFFGVVEFDLLWANPFLAVNTDLGEDFAGFFVEPDFLPDFFGHM